jgi:hypothetical protein
MRGRLSAQDTRELRKDVVSRNQTHFNVNLGSTLDHRAGHLRRWLDNGILILGDGILLKRQLLAANDAYWVRLPAQSGPSTVGIIMYFAPQVTRLLSEIPLLFSFNPGANPHGRSGLGVRMRIVTRCRAVSCCVDAREGPRLEDGQMNAFAAGFPGRRSATL